MRDGTKPQDVWVTSLYGAATRQPIVEMTVDHKRVLACSPEKAREIASMLSEVSHAAEMDAFFFEFASEKLGVDEQRAAALMNEFRQWRNQRATTRFEQEESNA
jgi:hypothetical protein